MITEPQFLFNFGYLSPAMSRFSVGSEVEVSRNLYLPDDKVYVNPTAMLKLDF